MSRPPSPHGTPKPPRVRVGDLLDRSQSGHTPPGSRSPLPPRHVTTHQHHHHSAKEDTPLIKLKLLPTPPVHKFVPPEEKPKFIKPTQEMIDTLIAVGVAYHQSGAPAGRVEDSMGLLCEKFQIQSSWSALPRMLWVTFGDPLKEPYATRHVNVSQNLGSVQQLERVEELLLDLFEGTVHIQDTAAILLEIVNLPDKSVVTKCVASGLASFGATGAFFGGGILEALLGAVLGAGFHLYREAPVASLRSTKEFMVAFCVSLVTTSIAAYMDFSGLVCYGPPTLGAIVWDLPGLPIAMAIRELATKHVTSGLSRLAGALLTAFSIGFGLWLGYIVASSFEPNDFSLTAQCKQTPSPWLITLYFPCLCIGFFLLINARLRRWPGMTLTVFVAYTVPYLLQNHVSRPEAVSVIASFCVGVVGRLLSRFSKNTSVSYVYAGTLVLLPGGLSVKGMFHFYSANLIGGFEMTTRMVMVGLSLAIGSMLSNVVPDPDLQRIDLVQSW